MLPAIFIYILYLSLLILARESFEENLTRTHNYIWYVHLIFLSFGIFSILKSNVYQLSGLTYLIKKNNSIRIAILAIAALIFLWIVR